MTQKALLLVLWVLIPASALAQMSLQVDPAVANKTNYQLWFDTTLPVWQRFASIPKINMLRIALNPDPNDGAKRAVAPDTIWVPASNIGALNPNDMSDPFNNALTHEFRHLSTIGAWDDALVAEAIADSGMYILTQEMYKDNRNIKRVSASFFADFWRNMPKDGVAGNNGGFYSNGNYVSVAGPLELISRGWFKDMDAELGPLAAVPNKSFETYLALFDRVFKKLDGKLPSTIMGSTLPSYYNGPDGKFLWVMEGASFTSPDFDTKFFARTPVLAQTPALTAWVKERKDGNILVTKTINAKMSLVGFDGTVTKLTPSALNDDTFRPNTSKWADGVYRLDGCLLSGADCDPSPTLRDSEYFAILRSIPNWWEDYIFVFANGPEYGDLGKVTLRLASYQQLVTSTTLPGMLVIKLNGSQEDVTVTDGTRTRVFTPAHNSLSRFVLWTDRDQPHLYSVVNAADFKTAPVAPGSLYTAFGWGMSQEDPMGTYWTKDQDGDNAIPTLLGRTRVIVSANGVDYECPLVYVAQRQINFQMPVNIPYGYAEIRIVLGTTSSNRIPVQVAEVNPAAFVTDWPTQTIAAIIATGDKAGQVATKSNPAPHGEIVSLFVTGLGPVNPAFTKSGVPPKELSTTAYPVTVLVGGRQVMPDFAGLAPGFVGLYQINVRVPNDVTSGAQTIMLVIKGKIGGETKLYVL